MDLSKFMSGGDGACQSNEGVLYASTPDNIEGLEQYQPGGFYPAAIGDILVNQYYIMHKLGQGGSGTVWLARYVHSHGYCALKVYSAAQSQADGLRELLVYQAIDQATQEGKSSSTVQLLDHFWIESANGHHLCLAIEAAGPSLRSLTFKKKIRPNIARCLARQVTQGMKSLHDANICFGDVSTSNVLLRLHDLSSLTLSGVYNNLGSPESVPVQSLVGDCVFDHGHAPRHVYHPIDLSALPLRLLKAEAVLMDFGGSYIADTETSDFLETYTPGFADPEFVFGSCSTDKASDIFALACIFFELRAARPLFTSTESHSEMATEIVDALGGAPTTLIRRLQGQVAGSDPSTPKADIIQATAHRSFLGKAATTLTAIKSFLWPTKGSRYLRAHEKIRGDKPDPTLSISHRIRQIGRWEPWHHLHITERVEKVAVWKAACGFPDKEVTNDEVETGGAAPPPPGPLSEDELRDFEDLLSKMLTWERGDRVTVEQVLAHPWLNREYEDFEADGEGPWLRSFHPGYRYFCKGVRYL